MTVRESYLIKTYSTSPEQVVVGALIGIARCLRYNRGSFTALTERAYPSPLYKRIGLVMMNNPPTLIGANSEYQH